MKRDNIDKALSILAIITIVTAGILGFKREAGSIGNNVASIIPDNCTAEPSGEMRFNVFEKGSKTVSQYIIIENADAYGGKLDVAVLIDTLGYINNLIVIKHGETPSFLEKVRKKGLISALNGKLYSDPFKDKNDISIVSGATYTSNAIIDCARRGSRKIANEELGYNVAMEEQAKFSFGIPEISLIVLYIIAFLGIYTGFKYKKQLRWLTMSGGLIVLGFWFAVPLSLAKINTFILGFWPDWHTNLYWYILVFGFVVTVITTRKNIYCNWICPVGCIQDGLGMIGGAKPRFSGKINRSITWISRFVAWLAILLAVYFRNPVKFNYEIFGVALNLTGATYLFAITGIFFIASVFIKRPWCNYLCPVTPIYDILKQLGPVGIINAKGDRQKTKG